MENCEGCSGLTTEQLAELEVEVERLEEQLGQARELAVELEGKLDLALEQVTGCSTCRLMGKRSG
jgi:hypothetical protein